MFKVLLSPLLVLLLCMPSCLEYRQEQNNRSLKSPTFYARNFRLESESCQSSLDLPCMQVELSYPEMLFGPPILQQKINREIRKELNRILNRSFPYLSSNTLFSKVNELLNIYDYRLLHTKDEMLSQEVLLAGEWKEEENDYWVLKLEVWIKIEGQNPNVQNIWIGFDKESGKKIELDRKG